MPSLVKTVFDRAVELLKNNFAGKGIKASTSYYHEIWARDSFISYLGANLLGDELLLRQAKTNLLTFAKTRSPLGQVANFYDLRAGAPEYGFSGSTDSSCWFIIGLASLYSATDDKTLLRGPFESALETYRWLRFQDANNTWLIDSPQGADWMDAAIQRTGKTLYNNVLFLAATQCVEALVSASGASVDPGIRLDSKALRKRFVDVFLPGAGSPKRVGAYWPRMAVAFDDEKPMGFSQKYFLQYVSFNRFDAHFDTLSNLLCVLAGPADAATARSILATIHSRRLSKPYPVRVLDPPYRGEGASFDTNFDSSVPLQHRSPPYAYHNGAVWPFVGGFYVCALNASGAGDAEAETESLARANSVYKEGERLGFNEWIHGKTSEPLGQFGQSWNAGMYIAAVLSAKGSDPFRFLR
ncbi:MAG TPA: amylo-alpha-1,6-glucosidase [Nitrososphaerales archaeon]|nr:amylo-alpha-1,6-glucosidase [Nitrososphaerales archaeon]